MRGTMAVALGMWLIAGHAVAQDGGAAQGDRGVQAARHFAVVEAGLESGEIHADMLEEITRRPELYDEAHGRLFAQNIQKAITDAMGHLQHIEPLVQGDAERRDFDRVRQNLQDAQKRAGGLESSLADVKKVNGEAKAIERALEQAQDPLEDLAEKMKVPIDI